MINGRMLSEAEDEKSFLLVFTRGNYNRNKTRIKDYDEMLLVNYLKVKST